MVALLLGLFVLGGLVELFVVSQKGYQLQGAENFLQENLRIVADRVGRSIRMADFWGGNSAADVTVGAAASAVKGKGSCDGRWATALSATVRGGGGIYGYDGAASFPLDAACIGGNANYVPGSDVLVLRYADAQVLSPGPLPAAASTIGKNPKQLFLVAAPGVSAQLFSGGSAPEKSNDAMRRYAYAYHAEMYYLRPCSVTAANANTCTPSADGGSPLPTLMRLSLQSDGTLTAESVVEGVEQITFEYGVVNPTASAPIYRNANALTAEQWANVVAVRVSFVAINPTRDVAVPHTATLTLGTLERCTYSISQSGSSAARCPAFAPYGGDKPWQFLRATQSVVVQLRNRAKGSSR